MNGEQPDADIQTDSQIDAGSGTDPGVDATNDISDNEGYHGYSVDDETQPQSTGDSLVDDDHGLAEPLDEGFSPPERWSAGQRFGNTPLEESIGESLDQRLAQEVPEPDPYEVAAKTDVSADVDGAEAAGGGERAGRLVEPDQGVRSDSESDLVADDVGIDGAGAGAEEAAIHLVDDADLEQPE